MEPAVERAKQFVENHLSAKMDAYTLAVLANFATDYGTGNHKQDREFTRQAMQLLLDARAEKDDQAWWTAEETGVYGARRQRRALRRQALQLKRCLSGARRPARRARPWLTSLPGKMPPEPGAPHRPRSWPCEHYFSPRKKAQPTLQGTLAILLNGRTVEKLTLTPENNDLLHQFVFKGVTVAGPGGAARGPNAGRVSASSEVDATKPANTVEIRFEGKGGLAYQVVGSYFLPWDEKPEREPLSIDVAYDRTHLAQDDIATATATVKNNMDKAARMVMVDLGIPPGFDLLSEDLQDYQAKSANLAERPPIEIQPHCDASDSLLRFRRAGRRRQAEVPPARQVPDSRPHLQVARLRVL